jgi:dsRNA-specific ribonuclease
LGWVRRGCLGGGICYRLPFSAFGFDYQLDKVVGEAHDQTFYISCQVQLLDQSCKGVGSSRRQAEQEAARAALIALGQE